MRFKKLGEGIFDFINLGFLLKLIVFPTFNCDKSTVTDLFAHNSSSDINDVSSYLISCFSCNAGNSILHFVMSPYPRYYGF